MRLDEARERSLRTFPRLLREAVQGAGRYSQAAVAAAMGAAAAAPAVVTAFQSLGAAAPVLLGQFGAFGLGYLTNLVSDWMLKNPGKSRRNEEDVRQALVQVLVGQLGTITNHSLDEATSESWRHLAVLFADPGACGAGCR